MYERGYSPFPSNVGCWLTRRGSMPACSQRFRDLQEEKGMKGFEQKKVGQQEGMLNGRVRIGRVQNQLARDGLIYSVNFIACYRISVLTCSRIK